MAHARVALAGAAALALAACGTTSKPVAPPPPAPVEASTFDAAHMGRYHSTRFGVSLPLPDGHHWRIDDHTAPVMRATHAPTRSLVELAVWREDELVNRAKCEQHARERGLAPSAAPAGDEISTEVVSFPAGWDTGIWIGAGHDGKRLRGELVAFGAFVHKCLYFRFVTEADGGAAETLSDRLAFVRTRVFGGLQLDTFVVPRERPSLR